MSAKPVLHYFSICGRGEVARLVCAAGEVDFEDKAWAPAFDETGGWRQGYAAIGNEFGFPGVLPVLEHGDMKRRRLSSATWRTSPLSSQG